MTCGVCCLSSVDIKFVHGVVESSVRVAMVVTWNVRRMLHHVITNLGDYDAVTIVCCWLSRCDTTCVQFRCDTQSTSLLCLCC